jgi:hypothetical protein
VDGIKPALGPILERLPEDRLDVVMDRRLRAQAKDPHREAPGPLAAIMVLLFRAPVDGDRPLSPPFDRGRLPVSSSRAELSDDPGSLALAVGLLIDQTIVVLENVPHRGWAKPAPAALGGERGHNRS